MAARLLWNRIVGYCLFRILDVLLLQSEFMDLALFLLLWMNRKWISYAADRVIHFSSSKKPGTM
jgi:hypothetical protein